MELLNLLSKYNEKYADSIINIYLVYKKARTACLIESINYINLNLDIYPLIKIANSYGLISIREPNSEKFPRYLICFSEIGALYLKEIENVENKHIILGKFLDFYCYDHDDWHDYLNSKRISTHISISDKSDLYNASIVQVCEADLVTEKELTDYMNNTIKRIRDVLDNNFIVQGELKIDESLRRRFKALEERDYKYVKNNIYLYVNDLYNFYIGDETIPTYYLALNIQDDRFFGKMSTKNKTEETELYLLYKIWKTMIDNQEDKNYDFFNNLNNWKLPIKVVKQLV